MKKPALFLLLPLLVPGSCAVTRASDFSELPVRIGCYAPEREGLVFYRIQLNDGFHKEGVNVELRPGDERPGPQPLPPGPKGAAGAPAELPAAERGGSGIVAEILKGNLEGGIIPEADFIASAARALPITAVASLSFERNDVLADTLLFRKSISIEQPADLKGKTIGVSSAGPLALILAGELFRRMGLDIRDLAIRAEMDRHKLEAAMKTGEIDGGLFDPPAARRLVKAGTAYVYRKDLADAGLAHALLIFRNDFIKAHPGTVKGVVTAYLKQLRYGTRTPESGSKKASEPASSDEPGAADGTAWRPYPRVSTDLLGRVQELMVKYRAIEEKINLSPYIDNAFVDEAYIPRNIILIGWDGVDREAAKELLSAWELPNLKQLMAGGTSFDIYDEESEVPGAGRPELPAGSPRMAGAAGGYTRQAIPAGPDIFKSIKRSDPSIKTVMVAESQSFYAGTVDVREQVRPGASSLAAEKAVDLLTKYAAGRIFAVFQFDEPARARERYGSGSPEYRQAIVSSDAALGTLVSALKILGIYDDTLVYVVAGLEPGFLRAGQRSPP